MLGTERKNTTSNPLPALFYILKEKIMQNKKIDIKKIAKTLGFVLVVIFILTILIVGCVRVSKNKDNSDCNVAYAYHSTDDIYNKVAELETLVNTLKSQITSIQSTLTASEVEKIGRASCRERV